jgi:hypothetical protein
LDIAVLAKANVTGAQSGAGDAMEAAVRNRHGKPSGEIRFVVIGDKMGLVYHERDRAKNSKTPSLIAVEPHTPFNGPPI